MLFVRVLSIAFVFIEGCGIKLPPFTCAEDMGPSKSRKKRWIDRKPIVMIFHTYNSALITIDYGGGKGSKGNEPLKPAV